MIYNFLKINSFNFLSKYNSLIFKTCLIFKWCTCYTFFLPETIYQNKGCWYHWKRTTCCRYLRSCNQIPKRSLVKGTRKQGYHNKGHWYKLGADCSGNLGWSSETVYEKSCWKGTITIKRIWYLLLHQISINMHINDLCKLYLSPLSIKYVYM